MIKSRKLSIIWMSLLIVLAMLYLWCIIGLIDFSSNIIPIAMLITNIIAMILMIIIIGCIQFKKDKTIQYSKIPPISLEKLLTIVAVIFSATVLIAIITTW